MKISDIPVSKENICFSGVIKLIGRTVYKYFKLPLVALLISGIISGIAQIVSPRLIQQFIDDLIAGVSGFNSFAVLAFLAMFARLCGAVFESLSEKLSFYIATQAEDMWRYTALYRFYNLPMKWQDQHDSGEIGSKMDRGGSAIYEIIYEIVGQNLLVSIITLMFVLVYVIFNYPLLSLIFLIPIPVYVITTYVNAKKIVEIQAKSSRIEHSSFRTFYDGIGNLRYVKTFGREKPETEKFARKWNIYHLLEYARVKISLKQNFLQKSIEAITRAALLIAGVFAVKNGNLSVGELVFLTSLQYLTFLPLERLNQLFIRIRRVARRSSNLFALVAEADPLADKPDALNLPVLKKEIKLENVHFHYSKNLDALHDINLSIKSGTTTAIVGRSGAGKSTLAMLLMRFYDPDEGKITWNSMNLKDAKKSSLRKKMTLILQDTTLFNRSIAENIAYARPDASKKDIEEAAKLAHAHDFIKQLPKEYNSIVGERGVRLSGGQRQRITIARALLLKPEVLIMDEATSHLDSETEVAIKSAIKKLHGKYTQVIIAHRFSTILHADNIVLMEKGRILAQGRHKELLKHPIYRKLCRLQFHK